MKRVLGILLLLLLAAWNIQAQDQKDSTQIKFSCLKDTAPPSPFFPKIQLAAQKLNAQICDSLLVPDRTSITAGFPRDEVSEFGALVKRDVGDKLKSVELKNLGVQLDYFEKTLLSGELFPLAMPRFYLWQSANWPDDRNSYYSFAGSPDNIQGVLTPTDDAKCKEVAGLKSPCAAVLKQLVEDIEPYQLNANTFTAFETRVKLFDLSKDWDAYFESARAQTFADLVLTTLLERRHFAKDYLVGPPPRQWFLLHPNVAMELVNGAPDGENLTSAFYIEWLGVNWWRDSIIGIPIGISLSSIYSDRPEVDDVGHGLTLHLDNKYVVGYANHGGESGFYISLDLLKLFENKQEQASRYRDRVKALIE